MEYWDRVGYRILLVLMVVCVVGFGTHAIVNRPGPPAGWDELSGPESPDNPLQARPRNRFTPAIWRDYAGELRHELSRPVPETPAALGDGFAPGGNGRALAIPGPETEATPPPTDDADQSPE